MRRVLRLLCVGWLPPYLSPSGAGLCLGSRVLEEPRHAVEGDPTPGRRLCRCPVVTLLSAWLNPLSLWGLRCAGDRSGHGPQASRQLTGHGPGHDRGVCASCPEASVPFTEAPLGVPPDVLDDCGVGVEAPWHMSAGFRGRARGPGAFAEAAAGMGGARCGNRLLAAWLPGGVCGGAQAQTCHPCSWGSNPGQGPHCRSQGDGPRALHATQGRQRLDHRGHTPGVPVLVAFVR
jgi:hypothetical protein